MRDGERVTSTGFKRSAWGLMTKAMTSDIKDIAKGRQLKGVTAARRRKGRQPPMNPWVAQIVVHRQHHRLGYFLTIEDAARAYDFAALRYYGDQARLNFPIVVILQPSKGSSA